jgi:hypothetical protein
VAQASANSISRRHGSKTHRSGRWATALSPDKPSLQHFYARALNRNIIFMGVSLAWRALSIYGDKNSGSLLRILCGGPVICDSNFMVRQVNIPRINPALCSRPASDAGSAQ